MLLNTETQGRAISDNGDNSIVQHWHCRADCVQKAGAGLRLMAALFSLKTETCHLEFCSSLGLPRPCLWSLARPYFNCTLAQYLQWWEWIEEKLQNISSSVNGASIPILELQSYGEVILINAYKSEFYSKILEETT